MLQERKQFPVLEAVIGARVDGARLPVVAADPEIVSAADVVIVLEAVLVPAPSPESGNLRDLDWRQQLPPLQLAMPDRGITSRKKRKKIVAADQGPVVVALTKNRMTLEIQRTGIRRSLKQGWPEQPWLDWSNVPVVNLEMVEESPAQRAGSGQVCPLQLQAWEAPPLPDCMRKSRLGTRRRRLEKKLKKLGLSVEGHAQSRDPDPDLRSVAPVAPRPVSPAS